MANSGGKVARSKGYDTQETKRVAQELLLPSALRERTGLVICRLATHIRKTFRATLAESGLNLQQHAILCCLAERGPCGQTELVTRLGLDSGDAVAFLNRLQEEIHIWSDQDERDRRRQVLSLVPCAEDMLESIEMQLDHDEAELFASLTPAQREALHEWATRLVVARSTSGMPAQASLPRASEVVLSGRKGREEGRS